jgi:hypothetical protein
LELSHECLGLAHVQGLAEDAICGELLKIGGWQAEDDFGMADGESAVADVGLEFRWESKKAEGIGDDDAAFADTDGGVFLGKFELVDELSVALGLLDGIEVFALEILDQGEFEGGAIIGLTDHHGDFGEAEELSGAPAAFAGDEFVTAGRGTHDKGLDDAAFADGIGEFVQGYV